MLTYGKMLVISAATFGYLLNMIAYATRIYKAYGVPILVMGMCIITFAYILLTFGSFLITKKYWSEVRSKKDDNVRNPNIQQVHKKDSNIYLTIGYAIAFIFFSLIFIFPQLTFHIRYYDVFAALGYFAMLMTKFLPVVIPTLLLFIYYAFGSFHKFIEDGVINKLQFIGRMILAIVYLLFAIGKV